QPHVPLPSEPATMFYFCSSVKNKTRSIPLLWSGTARQAEDAVGGEDDDTAAGERGVKIRLELGEPVDTARKARDFAEAPLASVIAVEAQSETDASWAVADNTTFRSPLAQHRNRAIRRERNAGNASAVEELGRPAPGPQSKAPAISAKIHSDKFARRGTTLAANRDSDFDVDRPDESGRALAPDDRSAVPGPA